MKREYMTNGGRIISKDGFGNLSLNGQPASAREVKQVIAEDGGRAVSLRDADRRTKQMAEQIKSTFK